MLSFDALFGLPRKKAAGNSFRPPLHGSLMFGDQSNVDEFVATRPRKVTKVTLNVGILGEAVFNFITYCLTS